MAAFGTYRADDATHNSDGASRLSVPARGGGDPFEGLLVLLVWGGPAKGLPRVLVGIDLSTQPDAARPAPHRGAAEQR